MSPFANRWIVGLLVLALLAVAGSAQAGVIGYWNFDETSGVFAGDASGNGAVGFVKGGPARVAGKFGGAISFDGGNDEVLINNVVSAFSTLNSQVTIAFWQNGTAQRNQTVFGGTVPGGSTSGRVLNSHLPWGDNTIYWDAGQPGYDRINQAATAADYTGGWTHWAFTKNAATGTMNIYRNGALWLSGAGLTKAMSGTGSFGIGSESGANYWLGQLDDFAVWDQELSPADIANLAAATAPMTITSTAINNSLANSGGTLSPGGAGTLATTTFGRARIDVALAGTANESSNPYGTIAGRAIDGRISGVWGENSVTHTNNEAGAWWEVDLGSMQTLDSVTLWNRTDCCGDRLSNFRISVLDAAHNVGSPVWFQDFVAQPPNPFNVTLPGGTTGRYLRVSTNAPTGIISLAEAQVWGLSPTESNYTQGAGGTLYMDMDAFAGTADKLVVPGTLTLGGTLQVNLLAGAPALGQRFDLLDFGARSGAFSAYNLPALAPGLSWGTNWLYATGELVVTGAPQEVTWTGAVNNMWSNNGNWTPTGPSNNNVTVEAGLNQPVMLDVPDVVNMLRVGRNAGQSGTVTQTAGSLVIGADFHLGDAGGSTGVYNLQGGSLTTTSPGNSTRIGNGGSGTLNQSGGTSEFNGYVTLADNGGPGVVNLSGGSMTTNGGYLTIGMRGPGPATFNLSGTGVLTSNSPLYVGSSHVAGGGSGTFNQTGGSATVNNTFWLGNQSGTTGTYNLSSGSLTVNNISRLGNVGTGVFNQSGGTSLFNSDVYMSDNGGPGTVNLTGGSMTTAGNYFTLGMRGPGIVNVSGTGSLTSNSPLYVGSSHVGNGGSGTVNQTGGTVTVTRDFYLGNQGGTTGTYNLSGGTLNVTAGVTRPGVAGSGVINQTGGTASFASEVNMADGFGSAGAYNLSGGTAAFTGAGGLTVGMRGSARIDVSGAGTLNATTTIYVGSRAVAGAGSGVILQTGGTVNANALDSVRLANQAGTTGTYQLYGGTLNARSLSKGPGNGAFAMYGGTLNAEFIQMDFTQQGGRLSPGGPGVIGTTFVADRANVATSGTASQSTEYGGYPASNAIDGNYGNFSHTAASDAGPWWQVNLGTTRTIPLAAVFNRPGYDSRLVGYGGFRAEVIESDGSTVAWSQDYVGAPFSSPFLLDIPSSVDGQYLRLSKLAPLGSGDERTFNLAEVEVYSVGAGHDYTMAPATVNLALIGAATQSSTAYGGVAPRANDGNTDGNWGAGSVTHTAGQNHPWWQVDLGDPLTINDIALWNRTDCCSGRLSNFRVSVLDNSLAEVWGQDYFTGGGYPNPSLNIDVGAVDGRYVRVERYVDGSQGDNDALSLAEVQVFADTTPMLSMDIDADTGAADKLVVPGTLTLDGTLEVNLIAGTLEPYEEFDLLDWGSLNGQFDSFDLPPMPLPAMYWDLSRLYTEGVIEVGVPEPATLTLLGLGALGLAALALGRKRR